jgi:serine protease AprX
LDERLATLQEGEPSMRFPARLVLLIMILLGSTGVAFAAVEPGDPVLDAVQATNLQSYGIDGTGVTVAIIDTGVAPVAGLDNSVIWQENLSAAQPDGDQYGHGTFVAGLVHAVAPGAQFVSIKLSGANGAVDVTQVLAALQWVVTNRARFSIDVVNLSLGTDSRQSWKTSLLNFAVERAWDAGIVVVASAGNRTDTYTGITKPGDDPLVITVGASDAANTATLDDDWLAPFSSRGPTQDGLVKPDLVAPGTHVVSLRAPGSTIDSEHPEARLGDTGFRGSGTSFAAPLVAGVAAQMLDVNPNLTPDQVKFGLLAGARTIGGAPAGVGAGTVRAQASLAALFSFLGRANRGVTRSTGVGPLEGSRGTAHVRVRTARVVSDATSELTPTADLQPFDASEFISDGAWDASRWGASQWGASRWGAATWDATSWDNAEWWASRWG